MTLEPTETITSTCWFNLYAIRWYCTPDQFVDDDGPDPVGGPTCGTMRISRALRCFARADATRRAASVPVAVVATMYSTFGWATA